MKTQTRGELVTTIEINNTKYKKVSFNIMNKLCTECILDIEFMKRHENVTIRMEGVQSDLIVTLMRAVDIELIRLFEHLTHNYRPIATHSRRFSNSDRMYIRNEIARMVKNDKIEPSTSIWRAQILITQSENHRQRL
ncbi:hypothetical protein GJ496_006616 [Pomphorhynchus laevis]|nr:hypothetical protein GJ496_006616 [Pomphorhynchus laevis]